MLTNNNKIRSMKFLNLLIILFLFYNIGDSSSSSCKERRIFIYPNFNISTTCNWKAELKCDGNDAVLYIGDTKYLVKDMSGENNTLRLVDPYLAVGGCRLPNQTLSLDHYGNTNVLRWYNLIYFFNCTEEVENKLYKQIHCMDGPHSRVYAVYTYRNYPYVGTTPKSCRYLGRTVADPDEEKMHWNNTDGDRMMQMLTQGFVARWNNTNIAAENDILSSLKNCWVPAKRSFINIMREPNYYAVSKLLVPPYIQASFLGCLYHPPECEASSNSRVVFWFMLILVPLLDIILILLGLRITLVPLAIFSFLLHKYKGVSVSVNFVEKFLRKHEMLSVKRYDFIEIAIMTNQFKEKLGQGGFGSVYKGKLFSGHQVAIKILTNSLGDGDDFISEVATIGRIHHANIVRLIGFCSEGSKRALVYPYMPKGSLDKCIFSSSNNSLSIEKRKEIALGIARGIDYLHRGCQMQILHFDIKPDNVLLDHDMTPKIADFGLAKLYSREYNLVTLNTARGTIGYIAPELISRSFGVISHKADVYSFGMLLMEMASGRRNVNNHANSSSQVYYPSWIYDQLKLAEETHNYNLNNTVAQFGDIEEILYKVALWCIQARASNRPSMSRVIEMLQSDVDSLEMPPRPFMTTLSEEASVSCPQIDSCSIEMSTISEEISLL